MRWGMPSTTRVWGGGLHTCVMYVPRGTCGNAFWVSAMQEEWGEYTGECDPPATRGPILRMLEHRVFVFGSWSRC